MLQRKTSTRKISKCDLQSVNDFKIRLFRIKWPIIRKGIIFEASFLQAQYPNMVGVN